MCYITRGDGECFFGSLTGRSLQSGQFGLTKLQGGSRGFPAESHFCFSTIAYGTGTVSSDRARLPQILFDRDTIESST